jgi:hypothetical protein
MVKTQLDSKFVVKTQLCLKKTCATCLEKCVRPIYVPHIQRRLQRVCVCVCVFDTPVALWLVIGIVGTLTPPTASRCMSGLPFQPWRGLSSLASFRPRGKPLERETTEIRRENSQWSGAGITSRCQRTPISTKIRP